MRDLIPPTLRTIKWGAIAGALAPAIYVVWNFQHQTEGSVSGLAFGLRAAAVSLAFGFAFVLDDPSEDTTAATPISVLKRRALRVALTLPLFLAFWLALESWAGSAGYLEDSLDAWPLLLEVLAFAVIALAGSAVGSRYLADRLGGLAGAGAVVLCTLLAGLFPWNNGLLLRAPGTPALEDATRWWWVILAAATFVWWRMSLPSGMPLLGLRSAPNAAAAWFTRTPGG